MNQPQPIRYSRPIKKKDEKKDAIPVIIAAVATIAVGVFVIAALAKAAK